MNFIKYFKELLKIKVNTNFTKDDIEFLENKIKHELPGGWLLMKVKELKSECMGCGKKLSR